MISKMSISLFTFARWHITTEILTCLHVLLKMFTSILFTAVVNCFCTELVKHYRGSTNLKQLTRGAVASPGFCVRGGGQVWRREKTENNKM